MALREILGSRAAPVAKPQPQRHRRIGGTELGVLCGVSSFGTTDYDVWQRIVLGMSTFSGNRYSDRGLLYEPAVRRLYVEQHKRILQPHPGMILFEDCFACSLDDLAMLPGVPKIAQGVRIFPVDYKTASVNGLKGNKWGPEGSDQFPPNYAMQGRLYMAATGAPFFELFAAFGVDSALPSGTHDDPHGFDIVETRLYRLERDMKKEQTALDKARAWWAEYVAPTLTPGMSDEEKKSYAPPLTSAKQIGTVPPAHFGPNRGEPMSLLSRMKGTTTVVSPPPAAVQTATPPPAPSGLPFGTRMFQGHGLEVGSKISTGETVIADFANGNYLVQAPAVAAPTPAAAAPTPAAAAPAPAAAAPAPAAAAPAPIAKEKKLKLGKTDAELSPPVQSIKVNTITIRKGAKIGQPNYSSITIEVEMSAEITGDVVAGHAALSDLVDAAVEKELKTEEAK